MNNIKSFFILGFSICSSLLLAQQSKYPYSIAEKPWDEGLGNHRAVLEVDKSSDAVYLDMEWRRPDNNPEKRRFIIVNSETGDTVRNVMKKYVDNERCSLVFGPARSGTYFFYYLPYQVQKGHGFYYGDYLSDNVSCENSWVSSLTDKAPGTEATVKAIESRTSFDSFYPMEIIATRSEVYDYCSRYSHGWCVFPEDRSNPVRMRKYLPVKWMQYKQGDEFSGKARPNEYYAFQIGVWSHGKDLKKINYKATDLICGSEVIPSYNITCFNTEGVDSNGDSFKKDIDVESGTVQPLWFGVDLPSDIAKGIYKGGITITCGDGTSRYVPIEISVEGDVLSDCGDSEPWRHSRLRWLNSRLGEEDTPVLPYTDVSLNGNVVSCMGRDITIDDKTGLPAQINSWGYDVLSSSLCFVVETDSGIRHFEAEPVPVSNGRSNIKGKWHACDEDIDISFESIMEFDGWMNYIYTVTPKRDIKIKDIRLELPVKNNVASYFLGAGLPGQEVPKFYEGRWDTPETTVNNYGVSIPVNKSFDWLWPFDSFWIGNAHAGIHCELRGEGYSGPLLNSYRPTYPESWNNNGKGGFRVKKENDKTLVTVFSGERSLKKGSNIKFDFALLVTPVKRANTESQFENRYYHNGSAPVPTDEDVKAGVKIINIHHANIYNPYINYPFLSVERLKDFTSKWHKKGCKVKLYYTLRELTSAVTELWALRSFGTEILRGGNGGGYPWCREHLIDGYTPQWYHHFDNNEVPIGADAALLTSESDSRWYNYYIEGLKWMVENLDIDGIYLDDVSFGRDILKRMRRAMDSVKPGCIIDLHSNTGFSKGPANQYAEFFPYVDKVWFGESFMYDRMSPANWLVESSGIPFGLMGDMLHRGGNKWLGMQYGMTVRHPWLTEGVVCDPRIIWKEWDRFGIEKSEMIGFWEDDVPVRSDDDNVKVTVYKRKGKTLLSVGNYSDESRSFRLSVDWKKLGLNPHRTRLYVPEIPDFQKKREWSLDDVMTVEPRKGLLIYLEG